MEFMTRKLSPEEIQKIASTELFSGMNLEEIKNALRFLRARKGTFQKGEVILSACSSAPPLGLVLSGTLTIESIDLWGNRSLLSQVGPGEYFAETYAMLPDVVLPIDVVSSSSSEVLFLDTKLLLRIKEADSHLLLLLKNLLLISTRKNLVLSRRGFHTAPKSIRGKVMAYLNTVSMQKRSDVFTIPMDRQEMADYLNVDRTALSKELSKMQKEGIIAFHKNQFEILNYFEPIGSEVL